MAFNQDIKAIVPKNISPDFLFYSLMAKTPVLLGAVEAAGHGTGRLPTDRLSNLEIPRFDHDKEQAIATLFRSLDDKIEANRRMNETLERLAQAIFRDWFVDFGPTRRKQEGASDPITIMGGVTQNAENAARLADLFPDALADNGLPQGWEEKPIGEVAEIVGGATPSTKNPTFWEGGTHNWATPKDLSKMDGLYLSDTDRKITDAGVGKISSGLSPVGTVLLSSRAPIGYLAIASQPTAVNQGFIAIRPTDVLPTVYALMWCREYMDLIKTNANGSTFQEISKRNFRPLAVTLPCGDLMAAFSKVTDPIMSRVKLSEDECTTLAETRELLLPRLMSGEITLKDAEAAA